MVFFPRWGLAPPSEEMVVEQRNLSLSSAAVLRVNEFEFHFPKCHEGAANLSTCWLKPNLNPRKTGPKPHWAILIEEYIIQAKVTVLSMWCRKGGEEEKKKVRQEPKSPGLHFEPHSMESRLMSGVMMDMAFILFLKQKSIRLVDRSEEIKTSRRSSHSALPWCRRFYMNGPYVWSETVPDPIKTPRCLVSGEEMTELNRAEHKRFLMTPTFLLLFSDSMTTEAE